MQSYVRQVEKYSPEQPVPHGHVFNLVEVLHTVLEELTVEPKIHQVDPSRIGEKRHELLKTRRLQPDNIFQIRGFVRRKRKRGKEVLYEKEI